MGCVIAAPHAIDQSLADLAKQGIASIMSKRIVYTLEMVQVEEQDGDSTSMSLRTIDRRSHELLQEPAIGQARQGVEVGEMTDSIFRDPAFRNVLSDSGDRADAAGRVRMHFDFLVNEVVRTILPDNPMFEVAPAPCSQSAKD
jgi:hypothetical protein